MDYGWALFLALLESQTELTKFQFSLQSSCSGFLLCLTIVIKGLHSACRFYKTWSLMNFLSAWSLVILCAYVYCVGEEWGGLGKCCSRLCGLAQGLTERHNTRKRESEEDGRRGRMCFQNHNEMRVSHFRYGDQIKENSQNGALLLIYLIIGIFLLEELECRLPLEEWWMFIQFHMQFKIN